MVPLIAAIGAAVSAGFLTGRQLGGDTPGPAAGGAAASAAIQSLPNPQILARETRLELASLPAGLLPQASVMPLAEIPPPLLQVPALAAAAEPAPSEPVRKAPEDIAAGLSRNIAAIVRSNGKARLVLADRMTTVRRTYEAGDLYEDGWRIVRIQPDGILLSRGGQTTLAAVGSSLSLQRPSGMAMRTVGIPAVMPGSPANSSAAPGASSRRRVTRRDTANR
jgi:hypothetical protein